MPLSTPHPEHKWVPAKCRGREGVSCNGLTPFPGGVVKPLVASCVRNLKSCSSEAFPHYLTLFLISINLSISSFWSTGFLLAIGFGIYPSGWGSVEFKQACGKEANFYRLGHCKLSWAFFLFVVGTGSAFICAVLSTRAGKQKKPIYSRTSIERSDSFIM